MVPFQINCNSHCQGNLIHHDVILSPKELGGKYVKFNRNLEMTVQNDVTWLEPLRESAKIALNSFKIR
jgi:hypothetical protein